MLKLSVEHLVKACNSFPAALQTTMQNAIEQWSAADSKKFAEAVSAIRSKDAGEELTVANLATLDEILTTMLKINQVRATLDLNKELLELVALYLNACQGKEHAPSFAMINTFFNGASRMLISGYDNTNPVALMMHADGLRHLQIMSDFVKTPLFLKFIAKEPDQAMASQSSSEAIPETFAPVALATFCISDLKGLLHTRRSEFFQARLNFTLALLKQIPTLKQELAELPEIVVWARQLLDFGGDSLKKIFDTISAFADDLSDGFGDSLLQAWQLGENGDIPGSESSESVLTTEFVYRAALKEMLGDGVLSSKEEETLKILRDYLEIPPEKYQRIFQEVSKMSRTIDREFDAYAFFRSLTRQAMLDGVLEDHEKELLVKVANALALERETVFEIFAESVRNTGSETESAPTDLPPADEMVASWRSSARLRKALQKSEHAAHIKKIGDELAVESAKKLRRKRLLKAGGISSARDDDDTNKLIFMYEPACFELPLFILITSDEEREALRLRLKGEDIFLYGSANAGQDMSICNRALNRAAPLNFCADQNVVKLKAGMKEALRTLEGRYAVAVVSFPSGNPVFFKELHGSIEVTGVLGKAETLIARQNYEEAVNLLKEVSEKPPEVAEVFVKLGHAYRALAKQASGVSEEKNLAAALACYEKVANTWPGLADGWAGIGMVMRMRGKLDDAMANMQKALQLKPLNIANMLTYAFYGLLKYQNDAKGLLDFLKKNLEPVYNFMPMHPDIMDFLKQVDTKFGINLRLLLEMTDVDSRYQ
ncbi:MAG: hypothetical protein KKB51_20685 [Candidatus Riflebacteria bacterium]|nr:hypothetical protein [Candidatus Riflebacteria bacterium]